MKLTEQEMGELKNGDVNDPSILFRDIYPVGMLGFTKEDAIKIVRDAQYSSMKKHADDTLKAAFMFENIVRTYKKSVVCNMYTEAT